MFGKNGNVLNSWIKEFLQLVFIQTIQAFIYALVIAFIIELAVANRGSMNQTDKSTSLGIISVIALTAIFKVEDILKKIFGFGSTKADHRNAIASIAKTGLALKIGSRVLDNGRKLIGGAGQVLGSHAKGVKARKNYLKDLDAYNKDNGLADANSQAKTAKQDKKVRLRQEAEMARKLAVNETDPDKKNALMAEANAKLEESLRIDDNASIGDNTLNAAQAVATNTQSAKSQVPKDYYQKMRQFEANYNKELDSIKKQKREGFKNIAKGLVETGAATVGFTAGAIIGGADGDLDEALSGGIAGMGIGDAIGTGAVDFSSSVLEFGEARLKNATSLINEYRENVAEAMAENVKDNEKEAVRNIQSINKNINDFVVREKQSIDEQAAKAVGQINTRINGANNRTIRSKVNTAVAPRVKAVKATVNNHSIKQLDNRIKKARTMVDMQYKTARLIKDEERTVLK